jgi:hypothetical protein
MTIHNTVKQKFFYSIRETNNCEGNANNAAHYADADRYGGEIMFVLFVTQ